jgi:hypothetical protein
MSHLLRPLRDLRFQIRGLATAIHETSGLVVMIVRNNKSQAFLQVKVKKEFPYAFRSAVIEGKGHGAQP